MGENPLLRLSSLRCAVSPPAGLARSTVPDSNRAGPTCRLVPRDKQGGRGQNCPDSVDSAPLGASPAERCMESAWSQPTISYYLQIKIKNRGDFVHPRSPIRSRGAAGGTVDACGPCSVHGPALLQTAWRAVGATGTPVRFAILAAWTNDANTIIRTASRSPTPSPTATRAASNAWKMRAKPWPGMTRLPPRASSARGGGAPRSTAPCAPSTPRRGRARRPIARTHQARTGQRAGAAGRVPVEGQVRPGHLCGQGETAACPHAPVRELPGRPRQDTAAGRPDRQLRLHRGGERARVAGAGEEPHQPAQPVLQRRLQGRQVLPVHRAHQGRRVPGHQVHAREAPTRHQVLRTLHRQPRRPRHGGHRAPRGPFVRHIVRRMAAHDAQVGTRRQKRVPELRGGAPVLRRARGLGPRRVLRPHHAGGVRRERAAYRAVPVRPAPRVRGRVDRRDAGGGRRARLRARGTHQGTHRHHQRPGRQAARRVHAQPGRRRGGPVPRGDGGGRARVHGARGPHHQLERVRAEPRQGRARRRPAAHVPAALLRRHHVHPARGHPARRARGPRSHGGMAHREAGQPPRCEGALHARRRRARRPSSWAWPRRTRSTR